MNKTLILSSLVTLAVAAPLAAQDDIRFNVPSQTQPAADAAQSAPATAETAPAAQPQQPQFTEDQLLEVFGWFIGRQAGLPELEFTGAEMDALLRGLQTAARNQPAPYDLQTIGPAMERFMAEKQGKFMAKLRQQGLEESRAFMSQIRQKEGVVSTDSGLAYEIVQPGTGPKPQPTDTVRVHYTGTLVNGQTFDTTRAAGEPAEFQLNRVIPGWTEGLQQIGAGGQIRLYVPPQLAYGDEGSPGGIPPAATLIFDVELLEVNPTAQAATGDAAPAAADQK